METKGIKITVEQPEMSEGYSVEGRAVFGVMDRDGDRWGLIVGGLYGANLLTSAIGEASKQLAAMYGVKGALLALHAVLGAIGDEDGIDDMASKIAAAHEAALAIVGGEE